MNSRKGVWVNLKVPSIAEEIGEKANAKVEIREGKIGVEFKDCFLSPILLLQIGDELLTNHAFFPEPIMADLAGRISAMRKAWEGNE